MPRSSSGLLLVLVGFVLLSGFLTGNLNRWLGYLFDPTRPPLSGATGPSSAPSTVGGSAGGVTLAAATLGRTA